MNHYEGNMMAKGLKIAVVCSKFHSLFTDKMLKGAIETFSAHGGTPDNLMIVRVAGAYEIPLVVEKIASKFDAVVSLGMVIDGVTHHADNINSVTAGAIYSASVNTKTPIIYGIVTAKTLEQGINRAGVKCGNSGEGYMKIGIEMANLHKKLDSQFRQRLSKL
uniref:6,7-dimethyl-8-ribityllumazine synthase n=1 Tax=Pithovirus LCDPAC01 TaxID=2506600 RepID=A0A481YMA2_9VIRU|nr:MAG: 6,7-dimethyl-8-ribityllumazine synthase [Pithovirus LCDPAC01]